jgi:hypothetical protein
MKQSKLLVLVLVLLSMTTTAVAQQQSTDQVVKMDGTTIAAILTDITVQEIKFKKASYPTGPTYTLPLSQVKKIVLATGEEETFDVPQERPKNKPKPIDSTPFGGRKFLEFSEDGQWIYTDLFFPDNNRYLCVWNSDLELIRKIRISKSWYAYSQQITKNGKYLDQSIYYDSTGTELLRFKTKMLGVSFELSGYKNPAIVSSTGKRFLVHEPATGNTDRDFVHLFNEKGGLLHTYKYRTLHGFQFSHKSDMFYVIDYSVSKEPVHVTMFDADGKETGTLRVQTIMNNMTSFTEDKTIPQFSFDDQYIISKYSYSYVYVADIKGNVIHRLYQPMANAMAFSRDGKKMVTAGGTYFGDTRKIEDENGNKIDYSGGSIKIWSFEGQLLKEIAFPARVDYIQFTPNNDGVAVLIGDTGATVWLWEKDGYKLPDGFEKTALEIAKYQNEKHENAVKDARLTFWVDMAVTTYQTFTVGAAKVQSEKNRLMAQETKAFALSKAIQDRNKPKAITKSGSNAVCYYEYEVIETRVDGKLTALKMSNIYTVPSTNVTRTSEIGVSFRPTGDVRKHYVFSSWAEANKAQQKQGDEIEDKNDFDVQPIKKADQCK